MDAKCFADDSYWTDTFTDRLLNGLTPAWKETDQYAQVFGVADASEPDGVNEAPISEDALIPTVRKAYYATTKYVDAVIKYFYDGINRLPKSIKENTHVIITSDHGFLLGEFGRLGKWVLTEGATRVPLAIIPSKRFLKTYKKTKTGTTVQAPVDHIDVFPTLLEMAGIPDEYRPLDKGDVLPGVSLSSYFSDSTNYTRAVSISEYETHYGSGRTIAMRSKFFKYITYTVPRRTAFLFDYRGGDKYRMVERENFIDDPAYAEVKKWFENLFQKAMNEKDEKAWLTIKNIKPIDHDFSSTRGQNY
uniref:Sulfatase N-terminal domain-containing protein n=1 Tax=Aplanochytrium stocchinoi TaxID=215587 RepID=A0A7S3UZK9_9STRA